MALELITSSELKSRLKEHSEFLKNHEQKLILNPNLIFEKHIKDAINRNSGIFSETTVGSSVLNLIVEAFVQLPISLEKIDQQVSEISESDFVEALNVSYWGFASELTEEQYSTRTAFDFTIFYLSYALTLLPANRVIQLAVEMNKLSGHGAPMTSEKFLTMAEALAEDQYKCQPVEWVLHLV